MMRDDTKVVRFDSVDAYIADVRTRGTEFRVERDCGGSYNWASGVSSAQACELAIKGDPSLVASTTAAIDKIEIGMGNHAGWETKRDVWGERPDVGAYLTGNPFNMRRRVRSTRTTRHVGIYVSTASSQMFSARELLTRGQSVLALLETLQQMQVGIDLYLVAEASFANSRRGNFFQVIRVESRPLDLSTAAFAIAHPAFARNITYDHGYTLGGDRSNWPAMHGNSGYVAFLREAIGMDPADIWIPEAYATDPAMRDPARFVEEKINQIVGAH